MLTVADYPNMKKPNRSKLHRELSKKAYPATFKEKRKISLADLAGQLSGEQNVRRK